MSYHLSRFAKTIASYLDIFMTNTQEHVKAADFCIAKAGWSTVAEITLSENRFAVLRRDGYDDY